MSDELENDELLVALRAQSHDEMVLGGVLLKSKLGEGAAGNVYAGLHTRLNIPVAVKVLKEPSPDKLPSFIREARLTASIEHPNLVRIFDVNYDAGVNLHYIVMEFVDGCSAYQLLQRSLEQRGRALSLPSALGIIAAAARGMAAVHAQGIVHRDIKPDNLLVRVRDGMVRVADLGLAATHSVRDTSSGRGNEVVGTPGFVSPEALQGLATGPAADVYALGVSLYELLTGTLPHGLEPENIYYEKQLHEAPIDPRHHLPDLDPGVAELILKCLRRAPSERYANAGELLAALEEYCGNLSSVDGIGQQRHGTALLNAPVVMLVDDEAEVLDLMHDALEASGFRPLCFQDPLEALRSVSRIKPDVVLLDRHMPRLDGIALCRLLRQQEGYADLPVLMISGDREESIIQDAISSGVDDYLFKPAKIQDVVMRVRLLSKLHNANREKSRLENQWQTIRKSSNVARTGPSPV